MPNVATTTAPLPAQAVLADIRALATPVTLAGQRWYDVRPMLDLRERSPHAIDMAAEAIDYAVSAGHATRHPFEPHLLQLSPTPSAV